MEPAKGLGLFALEVTGQLVLLAKVQEKTGNGDLVVYAKDVEKCMLIRAISIKSKM